MNILASYNWLKDYLDKPASVEDFVREMTASGMSVEYVFDLRKKYEGMVVGVVKEVRDHPDADRLKVVVTDIGKKTVDIVCGGTNLYEGERVAVALPGAKVVWHGEGDPIELKETAVRGVMSHGMICASEEIGFEKIPSYDTEGRPLIWDISEITDAKAGTSLASALGLEDTLFDIEVTTNRPDAMSMIGLAREASAVQVGRLKHVPPTLPNVDAHHDFSVSVQDHTLCPRYQAVVVDGVKVGPSPWWLQKRLLLSGHRPINNVVDITNYVLREYGQPMHAFDHAKIKGNSIVVRRAKRGENLRALDGGEYELNEAHLVIADAKQPMAIAGVMGGEETGVTEETTTVVFECASFEPVNVRRTARALNLYSDAQMLFEKGLSFEATPQALARVLELVQELAGGKVVSEIYDVYEHVYEPLRFPFSIEKINQRLGISIPEAEQVHILESLGFVLTKQGEGLYQAQVPYWRDHDIEDAVDFSEEIARVYGYHNIPAKLPQGAGDVPPLDPILVWQRRMRESLKALGATELFHYSFTNEEDLRAWGFEPKDALRFLNPLSEDQAFLRLSLVPSVLRSIEVNQDHTPSALVFELAHAYLPVDGDLPVEDLHCVVAGYGERFGDMRYVKGVLMRLMGEMGVGELTLSREGLSEHWHPGRSVVIKRGQTTLGFLGELAPEKRQLFRIDSRVVLCVLNVAHLVPLASIAKQFETLPEYPEVKRDLAFMLERAIPYEDVARVLRDASDLLESVEPFDVYEGTGVKVGHKSLAIHLTFRADDHTLTSEEIDKELQQLINKLEETFSVTMRS